MIIVNGLVFDEKKTFSPRTLYVENGVFVSSEKEISDTSVVDAKGMRILPGLIDIHSHGAAGHDFCDADEAGLRRILQYEYAHGVTTYCPTSMTLPEGKLRELFADAGRIADALRAEEKNEMTEVSCAENGFETEKMARIAGFNMEGPFLSRAKRGAHREDQILPPDAAFFRECNDASGGRIRLVTLAPESEGAIDFIRELQGSVTVSLGHSNAGYDIAREAFEAGARHVTHLYNAMTPFMHREPGLIGAAADCENCMMELIADGVHVHESAVRAAFRMFPGRVALISDSMRATGMPDGQYELGGQQVTVRGDRAVLADGTIAGSVTNLFDCMRNAVKMGIPLEEAVAAATMNPAKSIGIYRETGSLSVGKRADMLFVDEDLQLVRVISSAASR